DEIGGLPGPDNARNGSYPVRRPSNVSPVPSEGRDRAPRALENRPRRGPDAPRPGTHGRGQRAGISSSGTTLRGRSRLFRDGELRRYRAPQREDARLPPRRRGRAPARDPAVPLRAAANGG